MSRAWPYPSSLWCLQEPLVLASKSAARQAMLAGCGIPFDIVAPDIDERTIEAVHLDDGLPAQQVAAALASAKALEVSRRFPDRLVLGADQTLSCNGIGFHKPKDHATAHKQLRALSGRTHQLTSAFCLARDGCAVAEGSATAEMHMRELSAAFLDTYLSVAGGGVLESVGCYQLENLGGHLFAAVQGDHFTILGLPMLKVLAALRALHAVKE